MSIQSKAENLVKLKLSEQYLSDRKHETKSVSCTKDLHNVFHTDVFMQQKITPAKTYEFPAPFYDELHFANYE